MARQPSKNHAKTLWIVLSFFAIYIIWGGNFLVNAWGIRSVPPFFFASTRFLLAGGLLLGLSRFWGSASISLVDLKNAAFAGMFLFTIGNGLLIWSLQYVDSGLVALLVSTEPLMLVILLWSWKKQRPTPYTWAGLALGLVGMSILVGQPAMLGNDMLLYSIAAVVIAAVAFCYIKVWISIHPLSNPITVSVAWQMIAGGLGLLAISLIFGEHRVVQPSDFGAKVLACLFFLVVFGSIIAFSAFNFLLKNVSPTQVATSSYVNPVVALFLGWWLNNEILTRQSLLATVLLLAGVVFLNYARTKPTKANS